MTRCLFLLCSPSPGLTERRTMLARCPAQGWGAAPASTAPCRYPLQWQLGSPSPWSSSRLAQPLVSAGKDLELILQSFNCAISAMEEVDF